MTGREGARSTLARAEAGVALIITLLVLTLVSVLMVGFMASIIADTRASGLDRDQTQAYAAAHAGLEQITSDLTTLFVSDFSPSAAQVAALRTTPPNLPGFSFIAPGGTAGSGYWVQARKSDANGNPAPEDTVNGTPITSGAYQGFKGIITPYDITVTARTRGGAEVRMRRTLQTVAIPVFQFSMFSETDLAFHAGEDFDVAGRVHTNGNLFLSAGTGASLTIADRVTAVKDIIRTNLPNGLAVTTGYDGAVRIPTTIVDGSDVTKNTYRNLLKDEGSLTGTLPRVETPKPGNLNPKWTTTSVGTYKNNIRNGDTGAKRLDLPLVADLDGNGVPDAEPIELIRRPKTGELATSVVYAQRFFGLASLRILLSDSQAEITGLPTILPAGAVNLLTGAAYLGTPALTPAPPPLSTTVAATTAATAATGGTSTQGYMPLGIYKSWAAAPGAPLLDGWIKIEMQRNNGTWQDVTTEILRLGITGKNLADTSQSNANRWNSVGGTCLDPSPNAIIRLQRVRDYPTSLAPCGYTSTTSGGVTTFTGYSQNGWDYFPNTLYDTREADVRDGLGDTTSIVLGGVMYYIELDVNNLRRWLLGQIGTNGVNARNENGYVVYFSDRRNNKDASGKESGEYGWENTVNLGNTAGNVYTTLDAGEDVNGDGQLQTYGQTPRNLHASQSPQGAAAPTTGATNYPLNADARPYTVIADGSTVSGVVVSPARLVARANHALLFRRALKIVNGAIYTSTPPAGLNNCTPAPCNNIIAPGLTIASENPVYVQGDYNATKDSANVEPNVAAAIIADSVTLLSNSWNDIRSFNTPTNSTSRTATATGYRVAIISGKTLPFPKPSYANDSFGSDGGAHNFLRLLENWNISGLKLRYRGSLVSFFISRQATGSFKCCAGDVYFRGDRDWSFDTDYLLPSRLPPATPMFRDVNTLTFRQLLRPTQ